MAKLRGEDDKALKIEQSKKLLDLEELLADARKRGNADEVKYYTQALNLQKEINKEERKALASKTTSNPSPSTSNNDSSNAATTNNTSVARSSAPSSTAGAKDVVDALDVRIQRERDEAARLAVEKFMNQLKDEAKRRT